MTTTDRDDYIDRVIQTAYAWIDDMAEQLGPRANRRQAFSILRTLLHTVRDRLPLEAGAHFAAQLPELLREVYYEGWEPRRVPLKLSREQFLARFSACGELPEGMTPLGAVRAGTRVMDRHLGGAARKLREALPSDVCELLGA